MSKRRYSNTANFSAILILAAWPITFVMMLVDVKWGIVHASVWLAIVFFNMIFKPQCKSEAITQET